MIAKLLYFILFMGIVPNCFFIMTKQ
ncbi:hypothetical protein LK443_08005 [Granulicatella elegans]|nr:hypothetical protein LK443_08005 [Granulicatella elegans]